MTDTQHTNRTQQVSVVIAVLSALKGCTQAEVARAIGVDPATISRRHQGRGSWSADQLTDLANYFDVPVQTFFKQPEDIAEAVIAGTTPFPKATGLTAAPLTGPPTVAQVLRQLPQLAEAV